MRNLDGSVCELYIQVSCTRFSYEFLVKKLESSVRGFANICVVMGTVVIISRVAPDIISGPGPGRNPAKFSYPARPDMAARYEVGFDHLSMPHCNWAGIHCFTNSAICTSLFHHGHVDSTHILVCWLHSYVMWCSLGLQLNNIRLQPRPRPRPDLQSQIRPRPDLKKSNPVQP